MSHTPGPWSWDKGFDYGERWSTVFSEKGHELAEMAFITPELDANGRLMAAAPELLEALERFVELERGGMVGGEWKVAMLLACSGAMKAIAKARGEP